MFRAACRHFQHLTAGSIWRPLALLLRTMGWSALAGVPVALAWGDSVPAGLAGGALVGAVLAAGWVAFVLGTVTVLQLRRLPIDLFLLDGA
jgi:hypothetical protein